VPNLASRRELARCELSSSIVRQPLAEGFVACFLDGPERREGNGNREKAGNEQLPTPVRGHRDQTESRTAKNQKCDDLDRRRRRLATHSGA
jgi:hypothetical protein